MPTFKLDDIEIPFEKGETIIQAAFRQGIEIPHYCWHPGLSIAANCRMCLVEIDPGPMPTATESNSFSARPASSITSAQIALPSGVSLPTMPRQP